MEHKSRDPIRLTKTIKHDLSALYWKQTWNELDLAEGMYIPPNWWYWCHMWNRIYQEQIAVLGYLTIVTESETLRKEEELEDLLEALQKKIARPKSNRDVTEPEVSMEPTQQQQQELPTLFGLVGGLILTCVCCSLSLSFLTVRPSLTLAAASKIPHRRVQWSRAHRASYFGLRGGYNQLLILWTTPALQICPCYRLQGNRGELRHNWTIESRCNV